MSTLILAPMTQYIVNPNNLDSDKIDLDNVPKMWTWVTVYYTSVFICSAALQPAPWKTPEDIRDRQDKGIKKVGGGFKKDNKFNYETKEDDKSGYNSNGKDDCSDGLNNFYKTVTDNDGAVVSQYTKTCTEDQTKGPNSMKPEDFDKKTYEVLIGEEAGFNLDPDYELEWDEDEEGAIDAVERR